MSVKRLIGKLVVAGLLASGAGVATAGPSSAVPRDVCMDEANYMQQESLFQTAEDDAFDVYTAWQNAEHYTNPVSGEETWAADLPTGTVYVHTLGSYNYNLWDSVDAYAGAVASHASFESTVDICPW